MPIESIDRGEPDVCFTVVSASGSTVTVLFITLDMLLAGGLLSMDCSMTVSPERVVRNCIVGEVVIDMLLELVCVTLLSVAVGEAPDREVLRAT